MKVVRNFIGYLLTTCIVLGALANVLPGAAFAPDGPLLTILNRVSTFDFGRRKLGTNLFRVEEPSVGGQGLNRIETDLFQIEGKLFQ
jgi:hypothetical protein